MKIANVRFRKNSADFGHISLFVNQNTLLLVMIIIV